MGRHPSASASVDDDATKSPILGALFKPHPIESRFVTELSSSRLLQGRRIRPSFGANFMVLLFSLISRRDVDCDSKSYLPSSLAPALPLAASASPVALIREEVAANMELVNKTALTMYDVDLFIGD